MTKPSNHGRSALATNAEHKQHTSSDVHEANLCVCDGQAVATQYPSMAQPADKQCRHGRQDGTNMPSPPVTVGLTTVSSAECLHTTFAGLQPIMRWA